MFKKKKFVIIPTTVECLQSRERTVNTSLTIPEVYGQWVLNESIQTSASLICIVGLDDENGWLAMARSGSSPMQTARNIEPCCSIQFQVTDVLTLVSQIIYIMMSFIVARLCIFFSEVGDGGRGMG